MSVIMIDWSQIIHEHGGIVVRIAFRLLGHDADAQDCFQKTFLAAVQLAQKEPIRHWPAVLKRLASMTALQMLRSTIRNRLRSESFPEALTGSEIDPFDIAAESELADGLRRALANIDPQQAELFTLVCLEGVSNREAAELMSITSNHAGVLLLRARQSLREKLESFTPADWRS
jgi:RNA polymerase sigma-70 factor, ECF subfamily